MILECLERVYQSAILAGANEAARAHDVNLLCFAGGPPTELGESIGRRSHIYTSIGQGTCDGLVVATTTLATFSCLQDLERARGVWGKVPRASIAASLPGASAVLVDNAAGMRALVEHLIVAHHKRAIAFIKGREGNAEADVRFAAYRAALQKHHIPFDEQLVVSGDFLPQAGRRAVEVLCDERHIVFDAVVAANDIMALAALAALRTRGIKVPHDVALVGFDDDAAAAADPMTPLTTVRQPTFDLGATALVDVLQQLDGATSRKSLLPTRLVLRRSCGCDHLTDDIPSPSPTSEGEAGSWRKQLEVVRAHVVQSMGEALSPGFHHHAESAQRAHWLDQVLASYAAGIDREAGPAFPEVLTAAMTATRQEGEALARWNAALSVMRHDVGSLLEAQPDTVSRPRRRRAEDLLHAGRALVADLAERTESTHRLKYEDWMRSLRRASGELLRRVGTSSWLDGLGATLLSFDIPSAFVIKRQDDGTANEEGRDRSRRALAAVVGHPEPEVWLGHPVAPSETLPAGAWPSERRFGFVVEPLLSQEEELGHVVLEIGPQEGLMYEAARDHITSALIGERMFRRLVEENRLREAAERQRLERELQIAVQIQTSILPKDLSVQGFVLAGGMIPATEVGGDYYDVLPTDDGCWIGIGDVAGHGLTSGLVMLMIQSVIAGVVRANPGTGPREVLLAVNATLFDNIRRRLHQDHHATLTVLRCRASGRVTFAGAHEDLLVWRAAEREVETFTTPGPWMGAVKQLRTSLVETELRLKPGDILVGHTDGITEARDPQGEFFGLERLVQAVATSAAGGPAAVRDAVLRDVTAFAPVRVDDVTILAVEYRP